MRALTAGGLEPAYAESLVSDFQGAIATGKCRTTGNDIDRLSGASGRPTAEYLAGLLRR